MRSKFPKDLTGLKFSRWTVLGVDIEKSKKSRTYWTCQCDCGSPARAVQRDSLTGERSKSCGCVGVEKVKEIRTSHNMYNTKIYRTWSNMIQRCTNKNNNRYQDYGGRGITVIDEWLDFKNFFNDMYDDYIGHSDLFGEKNTTLERIDVNLGYSKDNCKWETYKNQRINQRNHRIINIDGINFKTFKEISEHYGIKERTIKDRFYRGKTGADLVSPVKASNKQQDKTNNE